MRSALAAAVALLLAATTAGCDSSQPDPVPDPSVSIKVADRDRLAGLAAVAKDRRYVGTYRLSSPNRADRTVTFAYGTDGTWVVGVPGGALSGLADIAIYHSNAGLFQCLLGPAAGTAGSRPDLGPLTPACVAAPTLAATADPRVQHVFVDWLDPLKDRAIAISVAAATLDGGTGSCFSVESNSATLALPLDAGVYCFADDGVLTGARLGFGTLILTGTPAPAPATVSVPAPVVSGAPVPITAPPAPTGSAMPAASH